MKLPARRVALVFAALAVTSLAQAHPGHDDGHELTWDFSHLAAHPVATGLCATMLGAAVWGACRLVRAASASARQAERVDRRR